MKKIKVKYKTTTKMLFFIMALLFSWNIQAQTCDFTINNTGSTGGDTEFLLVVDPMTGFISGVYPGGSATIMGIATGTVPQEVHHLVYDSSNPPTNVPPVMGQDITTITGGCTNDFLNDVILLECLCADEQIDATYTPDPVNGGDGLSYFLVDPASGAILDVNTTGDFGTDEGLGDYFIYALNFDTADPPSVIPAVGGNISDFSADGCYNPNFLSSACCAQKINCCTVAATLNPAIPTCDAPNGNLVFTIDVTGANGTITGDNSATFTDNGGGSWTGTVPVVAGTSVMVTVSDDLNSGATDCTVMVTADATFYTCDDTGNPVCSFGATLDLASFVCDATDGTTATGQIVIVGANGTNVTIDDGTGAVPIGGTGGDGSYAITVNLNTSGSITVADPDGLIQPCQSTVNYDLTNLTCDGVDPSDPPIGSGNCTLTASLDMGSLACQADGSINGTIVVGGAIDGMIAIDGTVMGGMGNYTVNFPVNTISTFTVSDESYTGTDPVTCEVVVTIDMTDMICDGVDPGDPPIGSGNCTFSATLDYGSLICQADGTINGDIVISGAIDGMIAVDGVVVGGNGNYSVNFPANASTIFTVTDESYTGSDPIVCEVIVDANTTSLTCDGVNPDDPPTCSFMVTIDRVCDGNALYVIDNNNPPNPLPNNSIYTYTWYLVVGQPDNVSMETDDQVVATINGIPYYSPTAPGSYWVNVALANGCSDDGGQVFEIGEIINCEDCGN